MRLKLCIHRIAYWHCCWHAFSCSAADAPDNSPSPAAATLSLDSECVAQTKMGMAGKPRHITPQPCAAEVPTGPFLAISGPAVGKSCKEAPPTSPPANPVNTGELMCQQLYMQGKRERCTASPWLSRSGLFASLRHGCPSIRDQQ